MKTFFEPDVRMFLHLFSGRPPSLVTFLKSLSHHSRLSLHFFADPLTAGDTATLDENEKLFGGAGRHLCPLHPQRLTFTEDDICGKSRPLNFNC